MARRQIRVQLPNSQAGMAALGMHELRLNYSLSALEVSENNPRRADLDAWGMTVERMRKLALKPDEEEKDWIKRIEDEVATLGLDAEGQERWDALIALAIDIRRKKGVLQPIVAVANPNNAEVSRIVAGERRFLASNLANMNGIHVLLQRYDMAGSASAAETEETTDRFVENLLREQLSLRAVVNGISVLESQKGKSFSVGQLMNYTGYSRGKAHMLSQVMALPIDHPIREKIQCGEITTLNQAVTLLNSEKKKEAPATPAEPQSQQATPEARSNLNTANESEDRAATAAEERSNLNTHETYDGESGLVGGQQVGQGATPPAVNDAAPNDAPGVSEAKPAKAQTTSTSRPADAGQAETIATLKKWSITAIEGDQALSESERQILIARLDDADTINDIAMCAETYRKMVHKQRAS